MSTAVLDPLYDLPNMNVMNMHHVWFGWGGFSQLNLCTMCVYVLYVLACMLSPSLSTGCVQGGAHVLDHKYGLHESVPADSSTHMGLPSHSNHVQHNCTWLVPVHIDLHVLEHVMCPWYVALF